MELATFNVLYFDILSLVSFCLFGNFFFLVEITVVDFTTTFLSLFFSLLTLFLLSRSSRLDSNSSKQNLIFFAYPSRFLSCILVKLDIFDQESIWE